MDPVTAFHRALWAALQGLSVPVYDGVPHNAALPYVTIDTHVALDDDRLRERHTLLSTFLNIWSERRGQAEVLSIMAELDGLLHRQRLALEAGHVASLRVEDKSTLRDQDGETFSGRVTLRVAIDH